ncbi:MAG: hypothetical protein K2G91_10905 [Prevotella sp.]|nr:hypothetical protein [Prevotella sp.]MDE6013215.1 hypothetical protein [Prevotella sp.]
MRKFCMMMALLLSLTGMAAPAAGEPNEARRLFDKIYNKVFGPEGCTLRYDVNIIGLYKTHGVIWYKGKKQRFSDERVDTWNDGVTAYMVYRKKKTVEIHDANSDKKDKYSGRFKFSLDDFDYSKEMEDGCLVLVLKQRREAKGTIKEVRAYVDQQTLTPKFVKLKVAFIWTKIQISNFRSGSVSDQLFVFPRKRYPSSEYKYIDKR